MSAETERDVETIEHLDFAPKCEAISMSCNGQNPAAYLAVRRWPCCIASFLICTECVERKVAKGRTGWRCSACFAAETRKVGTWLEVFTLHPLVGAQ